MTTARWWQNGWIWLALVTAVAGGMLVAWLLYPAPIVQRDAVVPQLRGVATDQAVAELAALGLRGRIAGELEDPLTPAGTVSWQVPVEGTRLPEGSLVRLGVSSGPPRVTVPELVDLDMETASTILQAAGLSIGDSVSSATPAGMVVRTRPEARGAIRAGGKVDLTVSSGPRRRRS
mgnify:FL=1